MHCSGDKKMELFAELNSYQLYCQGNKIRRFRCWFLLHSNVLSHIPGKRTAKPSVTVVINFVLLNKLNV